MRKFNKKGFTLVELIVVIAIIGVLAAILVPTMIGYTLNARVSSANMTAAEFKKRIDGFLLNASNEGYGMRSGQITEGSISITDGVWTLTIDDVNVMNSNDSYQWDGTGTCSDIFLSEAGDSADDTFVKDIAQAFPGTNYGFVKFNLKSGVCSALYYTSESNAEVTMLAFDEDGWYRDTYVWNGEIAGVNPDGYIVGTTPVVILE